MSQVVPDWGAPSRPWRDGADTYGKHHFPGTTVPECELEMLRRAEKVRRYRHSFGNEYFPAQHSFAVGAGIKVTVPELLARCSS